MSGICESDLEEATLEWFADLGYEVLSGPDIAPGEPGAERESFESVVLEGRLRAALENLNRDASVEAIDEAVRQVLRHDSPSLVLNNAAFHRMLANGLEVETMAPGGILRGERVRLFELDPEKADENDWLVVQQLDVVDTAGGGTGQARRADVVVFVNGLPLAVLELKNPADEHADVWDAFNQLQTYKQDLPSLFVYNQVLVGSDDVEARLGSLTAPKSRFLAWRTIEGDRLAPLTAQPLEVLVRGVFDKGRFLELVRSFVTFESVQGKLVKKLAGYHQFHAVRKAVAHTVRASANQGDRKIGVVWHTQGSGKSLTMLFFAGKLVLEPAMENPTLVVLTDRNDLDSQLFATFSAGEPLLRQKPQQATDREHLRLLLQTTSGGVYFTTIQKFLPEKGEAHPTLSERRNIVVIADEAHRSQYGLKGKVSRTTGEYVYGYAKHMRDALPNASFIGFTGTPVALEDADTRKVFGKDIDVYDIQRAVEDEATVPIYYESRLAKLELDDALKPTIDPEVEEVTEDLEDTAREAVKTKWAALEVIVGHEKRIEVVAKDIVEHFEKRLDVMDGKAMVVCMSRRICVELYAAIVKLRPHWNADDDEKGAIKVVMTGSAADDLSFTPHVRSKGGRERMAQRFKDPKDPLKLVLVRDMWLTGFDVPCLHTMYIDKPMQGHNLMQAIARVNRVFGDKPGGLVVDYMGIGPFLKEALRTYTEAGGKGDPTNLQAKAVKVMLEKLELCRDLMHGFDYSSFFTDTPSKRLAMLPRAREHVLAMKRPPPSAAQAKKGEKDDHDRFLSTVGELGRALALAMPDDAAVAARDEVAFFQAVRAGLIKLATGKSAERDADIDHAIRQIVSNAIVTEDVVDVFAAAGLKKPDISILSDEFLAEVRALESKNVAAALLERLLKDELRERRGRSVIQTRSFAEMLENALIRYRNRSIDSAQFIERLIEIAQAMRAARKRGEELNLREDELYFYEALADSESARDIMGDAALRAIAIELTETVNKNTTTDWTLRRAEQAKLRTLVRRVLRKHGYPPDEQKRATDTVLEQAKSLAKHVAEGASEASSEPGTWAAPPAEPAELPFPIAVWDAKVLGESDPVMRVRRRIEGFEQSLAFLACALLGLLAQPTKVLPKDAVALVEGYAGKPMSMGAWLELVWKLSAMIPTKSKHPLAVAARAFVNEKGKPSELVKELEAVIQFRNKLAHAPGPSAQAIAAKEAPLTALWGRLQKALLPISSLRLVSRATMVEIEGALIRYQLRLHQGTAESFPIISDLVSGPLEERRLYLLDDTNTPLPLLPVATCDHDAESDRFDVFLPRVLGTKVGATIELLGILTGSKSKQKLA